MDLFGDGAPPDDDADDDDGALAPFDEESEEEDLLDEEEERDVHSIEADAEEEEEDEDEELNIADERGILQQQQQQSGSHDDAQHHYGSRQHQQQEAREMASLPSLVDLPPPVPSENTIKPPSGPSEADCGRFAGGSPLPNSSLTQNQQQKQHIPGPSREPEPATSSHQKVLRFKVHSVSPGPLEKLSARFKPSLDLSVFELNAPQSVTLRLARPAIVRQLHFDEKFLEKILYADGQRAGEVGSLSLYASSPGGNSGSAGGPSGSVGPMCPPPPPGLSPPWGGAHLSDSSAHREYLNLEVDLDRPPSASTIAMFWYVLRSLRFYGGPTEECPLELKGRYTDSVTIPWSPPGPPNAGSGPSTGEPQLSAFSRTVRCFEVSHQIEPGRDFPCSYLKLAIPSISSLLCSALEYSTHSNAKHSHTTLAEHLFPPQGSAFLNRLATAQVTVRGGGAGPTSGRPFPPAIQKQLLFFANAWRLFLTVLLRQSTEYAPNSRLDGAFFQMLGIVEETRVREASQWLASYTYSASVRTALRFFRDTGLQGAFEQLTRETGIQLEHSRLSKLYQILVIDGNWQAVERFLRDAQVDGLFEPYVRRHLPYSVTWRHLSGGSNRPYSAFAVFAEKESPGPGTLSHQMEPPVPPKLPGKRSGHAMVLDSEAQTLYLFGGFNGAEQLNDFWMYDIRSGKWAELERSPATPSGRSCHQMVLDSKRKRIYTLGRFVDSQADSTTPADALATFHVYDIKLGEWRCLSENTFLENGPPLLIDHQMALDEEKNVLYVLGGLIQSGSIRPTELSDFYAYDVEYDEWRLLRFDVAHLGLLQNPAYRGHPAVNRISRQLGDSAPSKAFKSRSGHSMLFHAAQRKMYILGGHRENSYCRDIQLFHVDRNVLETLGGCTLDFPVDFYREGFSLRASLDPTLSEIYIFTTCTGHCTNSGPTLDYHQGRERPLLPEDDEPLEMDEAEPEMHPAIEEGQLGREFYGHQGQQQQQQQQQQGARGAHGGHVPHHHHVSPLERPPRLVIKNRLWVLDLTLGQLSSVYRQEKCYNANGGVHRLAEPGVNQEEYLDQLEDDDDDYLLCNLFPGEAAAGHLPVPPAGHGLNLGAAGGGGHFNDPLVLNNIDLPMHPAANNHHHQQQHHPNRPLPAFIDLNMHEVVDGQWRQRRHPDPHYRHVAPVAPTVHQATVPPYPALLPLNLNYHSVMHLGAPNYVGDPFNCPPTPPPPGGGNEGGGNAPQPAPPSAFRRPYGQQQQQQQQQQQAPVIVPSAPEEVPDPEPGVIDLVPVGRHRPRPRFATQLVYDSRTRRHYLFGGAFHRQAPNRLNDLWTFRLYRDSSAVDIHGICLRLVRRQRYLELLSTGRDLEAVTYLREHLTRCYNLLNPADKREMKALIRKLFETPRTAAQFAAGASTSSAEERRAEVVAPSGGGDTGCGGAPCVLRLSKGELFSLLSNYFPPQMSQPEGKLPNLVLAAKRTVLI